MKAEQRARTEELFHRLAQLEPEARATGLVDISAEDPVLGAELESLLVAHDSDGLLDLLTAEVAPEPIGPHGPSPMSSDTVSGTSIGQYEIGELVGAGGMGDVYRARDTKLGRDVALKFLPTWLSRDPAARDRFLVEARVISAIDHSNVCALFDLGETDDGRLFLIMPYYEGKTLKQRLTAGPLPASEAAEIALQTARGLAAAHERGVVHRDIKPANLLLTNSGPVKVLDFGVAKLADITLTRPGETPGTAIYMSPEQRAGGDVDERSDLWSLGAVLFEMLTGRRPDGEPGRVGSELSSTSPALVEIVKRLLAPAPDERYPDADRVVEALKQWFRETNPQMARPALRRWRLGIVALLGAGLVAGASYFAMSGTGASSRTVAVLPFANLSADEDSRIFAIGLHDDLTTQLSRIEGLSVTSRTSVISLAGTDLSTADIGRQLGVGTLIRGSVRTSGGRVKLNIRLMDAHSEETLWAQSFDRAITAENVFAIQAEIAEAVAGELQAEMSSETRAALAELPTQSIEAWNAYNRARVQADRIGEEHSGRLAEAEAETATQLDPEFVDAWKLLVLTRGWLIRGGLVTDTLLAFEALQRLRQLSPDSPQRYSAEGYYQYYAQADFPAAMAHFQTARTLRPADREVAEISAYVLRRLGRWEESIETLKPIVDVDPRNYRLAWNQALNYRDIGEFEKAARLYDVALQLQPSSAAARAQFVDMKLFGEGDVDGARDVAEQSPGFVEEAYTAVSQFWRMYFSREFSAAIAAVRDVEGIQLAIPRAALELQPEERTLLLALAHAMEGDEFNTRLMADSAVDVALAELERRPIPDPIDRFGTRARAISSLALAVALRGREGDADEAVRQAEQAVRLYGLDRDALGGICAEWTLARVYVLVGKHGEALNQLARILSQPGPLGSGILRLDPIWDPIRDDPKFEEIIEAREEFSIY